MSERTVDAAAEDASQATNGAGGPPRRRRWVALLGLLGLVAGAIAGWTARDPLYRAEALVYIAPSMPSPQDPKGERVLPMFEAFVSFHAQLLGSHRVAYEAMESEAWRKTGRGISPELLASFVERRSIVHEPNTQHIGIRFTNEKPDVALAGVRALTEAYAALSEQEGHGDIEAQRVGKGRIRIVDRGSLPVSPSEDRRPLLATLGGVLVCLLGAGIGFGVGGARPIKGDVT